MPLGRAILWNSWGGGSRVKELEGKGETGMSVGAPQLEYSVRKRRNRNESWKKGHRREVCAVSREK